MVATERTSVAWASTGNSSDRIRGDSLPSSITHSSHEPWPLRFIGIATRTSTWYVLEGTLGALLGDERVSAGVGTWICKPRGQWHTFWNDGDQPCHIIEVISPAGFEHYFEELATALGNLERMAEVRQKYQLEVDISSVPALCERFGLTFPMRPSTGNQR